MTDPGETLNPFPGLRPFGAEEDHLFFGREKIVDQLLMRLREERFLAVIGASGCGKSSLVRAGLIPSLHGGFMTSAGSSWRIAVMRPGNDPIGNLAAVLNQAEILGHSVNSDGASPLLTEVTLRRSDLGLLECVRLARLPPEDNLLIVVDQFEELFRFKRSTVSAGSRDEAVAFVKKLLCVSEQREIPIYVTLTMRSDFIGECNEYPGLPEAINHGQFLVPRMTREQLRRAIAGPVLVAGGKIAPRLLVRLLNDVGDNPDRLPVLQHALMRTWDYWRENHELEQPIDIQHYETIGTIDQALSSHADEAYDELDSDRARTIAANLFKALTDTNSDIRGIRRPTTAGQLCRIAATSLGDLTVVIDVFRSPERSFLMPPVSIRIESETVIDVSHESLMRVWGRLIEWAKQEKASTRTYMRVARAAARYEQGRTGLWRDPDLEIALKWRKTAEPCEAWATRFNPAFEQAMSFLDQSEAERDRQVAEQRKARRKKLRTAWTVSSALLIFAMYALFQQNRALDQQRRAEINFQLAVRAVDEMLVDVAVDDSLADIPQTEQLRQQMLQKARTFFETLQEDKSADPNLRHETALAQVRLGRIYEIQGQQEKAEASHRNAIAQLRELSSEYDDRLLFRHSLGEAYDWFGEQLRPYDSVGAETAYNNALDIQRDLVEKNPDRLEYSYELGRTYNNRGILIGKQAGRVAEAQQSFEQAVEIFEALQRTRDNPLDSLRLARTKNNLAVLLRENDRSAEAVIVYDEAIDLMENLVDAQPEKRDYREGLARMYNNLGNVHLIRSDYELALDANGKARKLFEDLATPVPVLRNEIANNHNTRGRILAGLDRTDEAAQAYDTAVQQLSQLERDMTGFENEPELSQRFGNALANLAILHAKEERFDDATRLMLQAIEKYNNAASSSAPSSGFRRSLTNGYWLLADTQLKSGAYTEAVKVAETLAAMAAGTENTYRVALLYARATEIALNDKDVEALQRGRIVASYTDRTVEFLGQALAEGYSVERLKTDRRFDHLRNRQDLRGIIETAEESQSQ